MKYCRVIPGMGVKYSKINVALDSTIRHHCEVIASSREQQYECISMTPRVEAARVQSSGNLEQVLQPALAETYRHVRLATTWQSSGRIHYNRSNLEALEKHEKTATKDKASPSTPSHSPRVSKSDVSVLWRASTKMDGVD